MAEEYQITSSIEITASIDLSKILNILNVPYTDLLSSSPKTVLPQVAQTNLYTNGGEFKTPNGKEYIGSYHTHPTKGPMVNAFHTNEKHDLLSPISSSIGISTIPKSIEFVPIKGIIVDSETLAPIKGVTVTNILKIPKRTNEKGEFEIKIPSILNTPFDPVKFPINIIKRKYSPLKITPYTSTTDVKKDLGIIKLKSTDVSLLEDIREFFKFGDKETKEYVEKDTTIEFHIEKELNVAIDDLKKLVIPLLLGLLAQYGISKVKQLIEENKNGITDELKQLITCPPQENLSKIIETKNKLVKQINNVFKTINRTTEVLSTTQSILTPIEISLPILKNVPIPFAPLVNPIRNVILFLDELIPKLSFANSVLLSILILLRSVLLQVLDILKFLDLVTEYCSSLNGDSSLETTQRQISTELLDFTKEQSKQLSPVVTNINGFKMGVETEKTNSTLKRRRAIAKNKQGVVMLKGEYSFSSIDQILIDELVFYIQQNNLKAD